MNRPIICLMLILACSLGVVYVQASQAEESTKTEFITRRGDKLYEGDKEFRFLGLAAPTLHQNEGQLRHDFSNRFPDEFEIRDTLVSLQQMGCTATRCFSLSVRHTGDNNVPVYIEGVGQYNEEAFRTLDRVLAICGETNVRLIIPIIDSHSFWGWRGVDEFSGFRGKHGTEFWTDDQLKQDFRDLLDYLVNRRNTVTGKLYKDDPSILAWQLGNELSSYVWDRQLDEEVWMPKVTAWSVEMAAYLKQIDPNHLVMEGGGDKETYFEDPNIDIISEHFYEYWNERYGHETDLAKLVGEVHRWINGRKALIADELGMASKENITNLTDELIATGVTGGLLWSIRPHHRDGGFYYHNENGTRWNSYHWPGFDNGDGHDERYLMDLLWRKAHEIRGFDQPVPIQTEGAPVLLTVSPKAELTWRGVTGARGYTIERAESESGPWAVLAEGVQDAVVIDVSAYESTGRSQTPPLYQDDSVEHGMAYFYRVKVSGGDSESTYSNTESAIINSSETVSNDARGR